MQGFWWEDPKLGLFAPYDHAPAADDEFTWACCCTNILRNLALTPQNHASLAGTVALVGLITLYRYAPDFESTWACCCTNILRNLALTPQNHASLAGNATPASLFVHSCTRW